MPQHPKDVAALQLPLPATADDVILNTATCTATFHNQSSKSWFFCLFQQLQPQPDDYFSLVWKTAFVTPGGNKHFSWTEHYAFVLSNNGTLSANSSNIFQSNACVDADVNLSNEVTLSCLNGCLSFGTPTQNNNSGILIIDEDGSVQPNVGAVGIGMDSTAIVAVNAACNLHPKFDTGSLSYWCVCGDSFEVGAVLNPGLLRTSAKPTTQLVQNIQTTNILQLAFAAGKTDLDIVLNEQNILALSANQL